MSTFTLELARRSMVARLVESATKVQILAARRDAETGPEHAAFCDLLHEPAMVAAGEHPLDAIAAPEDLPALVRCRARVRREELLDPLEVGRKDRMGAQAP